MNIWAEFYFVIHCSVQNMKYDPSPADIKLLKLPLVHMTLLQETEQHTDDLLYLYTESTYLALCGWIVMQFWRGKVCLTQL